ncbi:hypothetical protein QQF64_027182 [Cirrhinus molitorella]|uniref:Uncharacterized protein n=1 Tax=Cirrhinus molitorella TaxID=172907 RepID=A0ABR3NBP6_9TELE
MCTLLYRDSGSHHSAGVVLESALSTCITTDNAANVIKAVELNEWTRLQCFVHRLHLAIENALKGDLRVNRATGLCKQPVSHFSHS